MTTTVKPRPLCDWAREVIGARMVVLARQLGRLAAKPDEDAIHDVRVAIRRVRAALRHLSSCLGGNAAVRANDALRSLAALLGEVRDLDIIASKLADTASDAGPAELQRHVRAVAKQRATKLRRAAPLAASLSARLPSLRKAIASAPAAGADETVASHVAVRVPKLVRRYFTRGRRLVRREASDHKLHRFRIRTKRVRYTLELYADVFPAAVGASLKHFQQLQEMLGRLQDQSMFCTFLQEHPLHDSEASKRLARAAKRKQRELRKEFFRAWKKLDGSPLEEELTRRMKRAEAKRPARKAASVSGAAARSHAA